MHQGVFLIDMTPIFAGIEKSGVSAIGSKKTGMVGGTIDFQPPLFEFFRDPGLKGRRRTILEFEPGDIFGLFIMFKKLIPMLRIRKIVSRLVLEKSAAVPAGAGLVPSIIHNIIRIDAVHSRLGDGFQMGKIDAVEIRIIEAEGMSGIPGVHRFPRAAVDLIHAGKEQSLFDFHIGGKRFPVTGEILHPAEMLPEKTIDKIPLRFILRMVDKT